MLFNSSAFAVFLPVVVVLYFLTPQRFRWVLLLIASYYFYMSWRPEYAILIFASTIVDYVAALQIGKSESLGRRRLWLGLSLASNLGMLGTFKYYNFLGHSMNRLIGEFGMGNLFPHYDLLLPVGISFYTFQTLSYTFDVYARKREPERHLGYFAVYVSFFPQLVAGPIETASNLLPQFRRVHSFDYDRMRSGLILMGIGYFKKVVVADRCAHLVDIAYSNPDATGPAGLLMGTVMFAFQIYADFSGYSDIAIGCARIMGFELVKNFDQPYFSSTITDFWRRWHMSLLMWFREYIYIPLGGSREGRLKTVRNTLFVFLLSGIWHGAGWKFVGWGLLHGLVIVGEYLTRDWRRAVYGRMPGWTQVIVLRVVGPSYVFLVACIGWVLFRADSFRGAIDIMGQIGGGLLTALSSGSSGIVALLHGVMLGQGKLYFVLAVGSVLVLLLVDAVDRRFKCESLLVKMPTVIRWPVYSGWIFGCLFFGVFDVQQFIYFQF